MYNTITILVAIAFNYGIISSDNYIYDNNDVTIKKAYNDIPIEVYNTIKDYYKDCKNFENNVTIMQVVSDLLSEYGENFEQWETGFFGTIEGYNFSFCYDSID